MAARVAGVHRIFKMGGAHAVAALAYGTESVPRVDKIVGPGNIYVATAKRLVFGDVAIDSEAGPTEVLIIADRGATPAWVAADLISQAEHDELASAILITSTSRAWSTRVQDQVAKQLKTLDRARRSPSKSLGRSVRRSCWRRISTECVELANRYAPEHLVIATETPRPSRRCHQRRRGLPGPLHAGRGGRLHRGPESRAAHGWDGALLLAARASRTFSSA